VSSPVPVADVVASAVAKAPRTQRRHLNAFLRAGATSPSRARPLDALGVRRDAVFDRFARFGIVREAAPGAFFLDEAVLLARLRAAPPRARMAVAVALATVTLVVLAALALARR
jgi:hypothetical protein